MISIGITITNLHEEKRNKNHYTNVISNNKLITFKIQSTLKSGIYNDKYIVDILKIDSLSVTGKALLNVTKDSLSNAFNVDDILITSESFQDIKGIINPYQFDYKNHLAKQYVYKQLYIKPNQLLAISQNKHTIYGFADAVRKKINIKLKQHDFDTDVLSILNALLLGQRQNLDKDIYGHYTNAGAVHLLAISGLHVALILLLLNFIFKPLRRFKYGRTTTIIMIVAILWGFAIIAGLSASVTRAVTMFSIIAIAMHLNRPTNIYNTLAISIFILLLFKPLLLFDVGFQLSYLAVIAIVAIQPRLAKLIQPKHYITARVWDYFTVGIAAQLGVLPISLFYFHQFPGLFFIANIIVIPFLGLILGIGILIIILAVFNALPSFLVSTFNYIILSMNTLMEWISSQDSFLFKDISFTILQVFSAYIIIVAYVQFGIKQNFKWFRIILVALLLFYGSYLYVKYKNSTHELTVFHKSMHTVIGEKTNTDLKIFSSLDSIEQFYNLNDYKIGNFISTISKNDIPSIFKIKKSHLLIIDSLSTYQVKQFKPDYILLTQSPKLNLKRMIDSLQPITIIADGSNYKTYIKRWKATCKKQKIPFHYTGEKGAFIFKK